MDKETSKSEKQYQDKFQKLIDWGIQTQLTWAVIFLTCFIGLIELLPSIPKFGSISSAEFTYMLLIGLIYFFLLGGLDYSILRTVKIVRSNFEWAEKANESVLCNELRKTRGLLVGLLYTKYAEWLLWLAILFLTFAWAIIFALKVLVV